MRPIPFKYTGDEENTEVYFAVMEPNQRFECAIIRKKYDKKNWEFDRGGCLLVKFKPEDTLLLTPGTYYYQAKIVLPNGEVNSLMPKRQFIILE